MQGCASFLAITLDVHPLRSLAAEHRPSYVVWIATRDNYNFLVFGEQVLEVGVRESVWVRTGGSENHETGNIRDPHMKLWSDLTKKRSGGDDFERDLCTDTDKDDLRAGTFVGRSARERISASSGLSQADMECFEPTIRLIQPLGLTQ